MFPAVDREISSARDVERTFQVRISKSDEKHGSFGSRVRGHLAGSRSTSQRRSVLADVFRSFLRLASKC